MAVNWSVIEPAFLALVSNLTASTADFTTTPPGPLTGAIQAVMANKQRPYVDASLRAIALCTKVSEVTLSEDESWASQTTDPDGPIYQTIRKVSKIVLRVKVESYELAPNKEANYYLEQLDSRVFWRTTIDSLDALGLALVDRGTITSVDPPPTDSHIKSVAFIELTFIFDSLETDPTQQYNIETLGTITPTFTGP